MLLRATSALIFLAGQLVTSQAHAGTVLKNSLHDLANDREASSTSYAQQGNLRVESTTGPGVVIFKDDVLYTLDTKQKTYLVVDQPTMKRMIEQLGPALKKMQ